MPRRHKCDVCRRSKCRCKKPPIVKIEAVCPPDRIRPALPLCSPWEITFSFLDTSDLTPPTFDAPGLFNIKDKCLQSVSSVFLAPTRPPTINDLDQSTIELPIAGYAGSITGEVYFFGKDGNYTASLKPYILEDGKTITLLVNFINTTADANTAINLIFVARLFYCTCCRQKKHCCYVEMSPY